MHPDRRDFIVKNLAAGFALAVRPVTAQTITTSTEGLVAGEITMAVTGGRIPAYRAMPATGKSFPVVLVVQEIFGVHEHIKDICRRFAKLGYFAIAPEMYARQGDVSKIDGVQKIISEVVSKVPDTQVMADLDSAVEYAASTKKCNINKLAITGFCWGGRITWMYAAHNPKLKAGAAWYGRLTASTNAPTNPMTPQQPIDVVADLHAPVLGLYGGKDTGIPLDSIEKMREALKANKKTANIIVYPDAQHGFNADYRPSYSKVDSEAAWKELLNWFKKYGVA